jgi:hypothetical protein
MPTIAGTDERDVMYLHRLAAAGPTVAPTATSPRRELGPPISGGAILLREGRQCSDASLGRRTSDRAERGAATLSLTWP